MKFSGKPPFRISPPPCSVTAVDEFSEDCHRAIVSVGDIPAERRALTQMHRSCLNHTVDDGSRSSPNPATPGFKLMPLNI